jgi:Tfp pilus assembly protein PilX
MTRRSSILARGRFRRGGAYILVIGVAMLITVIGMGALLSARLNGKEASTSTDWEEAGTLAQAAVEHAMSYLNAQVAANPTTWRSSYTSYTTGAASAFSQSMGRGTWSWVVKDTVDGNFSNNYADPFTIYGIGTVNQAKRVYSVQVVAAGSPLDVLRCGLQAGGAITINSTVSAGTGPISSNTNVVTGAAIYGNVETPGQSGVAANVKGTLTISSVVKPMPSSGLYNLYLAKATTIPWSSVSTGIINQLLSPTNNPYGATNPDGVYSITVPAGQSFTISTSRIVGTLLISMTGGTLNITGPTEWQPNRTDYPSLIVNGTSVSITIAGSSTWLSEAAVGKDLNGNGTTTDDLQPYYQGIFHIIGSTNTTTLNSNAYFTGLLVTDGSVTTSGQTTFISNSNLYTNPPIGYGSGTLMIVPGSWIWDSPP